MNATAEINPLAAYQRGKRKNWPLEVFGLPDRPGVYLITCVPTGETYIGGTASILKRAFGHLSQAGLKHRLEWMPPVSRCIHKHGPQAFAFKVLETCAAEDVAPRELFWILKLNPSLNAVIPTGKPKRRIWRFRNKKDL